MGGSGGGSSGAVAHSAYIETIHGLWLDNAGGDTPSNSLVDAINTAYAANPFTGVVSADPDTDLTTMQTAVTAFNTVVDALVNTTDYAAAYAQARTSITEESAPSVSSTEVDADIVAHDAVLTDQLEDQALPAFRLGLLNINAVQSSAFVIGESIMRAYKARDVSKYGTDLRMRLEVQRREIEANHKIQRGNLVRIATTQMIAQLLKRADLEREVAALTIESRRFSIVARKEEIEGQSDFDEKEALWEVELFGHAGNLLAGPSGGTSPNQKRPSKAQSALGGALSGAAAGAAIGSAVPGLGTAAGAGIGALLGAGGGFL